MGPALISEAWRAMWSMGLPVGLFSFGLVWWAVHRGYLRGDGGVGGVGKEMKTLSKERKQRKKQRKETRKGEAEQPDLPLQESKFDPVQEKWMKFGGGFYGVVAFYTYVLVEWREIADFIANFGGFLEMLRRISIGAAIELFFNSIMNFVAAIAWPAYWIGRADQAYLWLWFAAAYGGYWLGIRLALTAREQGWGSSWLTAPRDGEQDD